MLRATSLLAVLTVAGPAFASGGLSCMADDARAKFDLQGGVTRGMGGPIFSYDGVLEILDKSVAADFRKLEIGIDDLTQYWFDDKDLRLLTYKEREGDDKPFGSVELTVLTTQKDEVTYAGTYTLDVYDMTGVKDGEGRTVTIEGAVECSVE